MTTTSDPPSSRTRSKRPPRRPAGSTADSPTVPAPSAATVRGRRRPARAALAVAFVALTMVAGWAAIQTASTTEPVVGVRTPVTRGELIERSDLSVVQVGEDPGLAAIPADQIDSLVGRRAASDLPAGSLVPAGAVNDALVPARRNSLVGVLVKDGTAPVTGLSAGAKVRLVPLPASQEQQQQAPSGVKEPTAPVTGTVVAVTPNTDGTGTRIDVNVTTVDAAGLQVLAAQSRVSIVIDSQER